MAETQQCSLCGAPIKWVELRPEGSGIVALDTVETFGGRYRLVGDSQNAAEPIERPGFQGYTLHDETCPKKQ